MKSKAKKVLIAISILVMMVSITYNVLLILKFGKQTWHIDFANANSRETYFTIHNVKQAQSISKGKGIKVSMATGWRIL